MMRRYACFFLALLIVALTAYGVNAESPTPTDTTAAAPTLDSVTLKDGTVTVRDRDTMQQVRVAEDRLLGLVDEKLHGTGR